VMSHTTSVSIHPFQWSAESRTHRSRSGMRFQSVPWTAVVALRS
jgi:hypothetical protein